MDHMPITTQKFISKLTVRRLALAALLYLPPVLIFAKLADEILEQEPIPLDLTILERLHSLASPALDQLAIHITNTGDFAFILSATAVGAGLLMWRRHSRAATALVAGVGGAVVLNISLKLLFHRTRPSLWHQIIEQGGYSFPSGHAMMSSALALSAIVICWGTRWRWLAIIVGGAYIALVGLSRVYLGVHFPTDIVAAWCVSLIWVLIVNHIVGTRPLAFLRRIAGPAS